ncbi:MAG TPA: FkbM family methyltransferase [Bryobacteraceae bacterium]
MISYAQNFEDVMLRRVFRGRKDGFYIDVGAMDPVLESVTKFFYDEGWSGINIEPNDCFYRKLLQERPRDINLKLALGEKEESRSMHMFENIGNSTFQDAVRDHYVDRGFETVDQTVRVSTLTEVCRNFVKQEIDFLKLDCEGWEEAVIRGADWDRFRPIVVVVEATAPDTTIPAWSGWEPYLIETARYDFVYFDGLNRFYVRREYSDLRCHFGTPPNVFDGFKPYVMQIAEQERDALRQERDALATRVTQLDAEKADLAEHAARSAELEKKLLQSRLWVGRLSQELISNKQRV